MEAENIVERLIQGREAEERKIRRELGPHYVMPDGATPFPSSIFERINPDSLGDTIALIEDVLPSGLDAIGEPMSTEERQALEALGGTSLATQVETIFSEVKSTL